MNIVKVLIIQFCLCVSYLLVVINTLPLTWYNSFTIFIIPTIYLLFNLAIAKNFEMKNKIESFTITYIVVSIIATVIILTGYVLFNANFY